MQFSFLKNLFAKFRGNNEKKILTEILSDSRAVFSSFGNDIYFSDFVNNAIDRIASEVSKIDVVSVIEKENSVVRCDDEVTKLFKYQPNPLQTTKDFLSSCEWLRRKQANCFIFPAYEDFKDGREYRHYTAFYPLNPISVELGHYEDGRWAIKFFWKDGTADVLPYEDVIHLKWRRGTSLIMGGGNDQGAVDDRNTLRSLKILDEISQSFPKLVKSSLGLSGVLTVKTIVEKKALEDAAKDFEKRIYQSDSGIVAVGLEGDYKPAPRNFPNLPDSVVKFLKDIIRERYGVSEAILSGDFDGKSHSAFYQTCLEDFIVEFEQAFSERLFTKREKEVGHRIKCYYSKVSYLSETDKLALSKLALESGLMTLNELRELHGLTPIPEGDRKLQSLNFVEVNLVDKYQLNGEKKSGGDANDSD